MSNLLDQLQEEWGKAERGIVRKGDLVITKYEGPGFYQVVRASYDNIAEHSSVRIIERAKPAWIDAEYVLARDWDMDDADARHLYQRRAGGDLWIDLTYAEDQGEGLTYAPRHLRDVSILVEQEVAA